MDAGAQRGAQALPLRDRQTQHVGGLGIVRDGVDGRPRDDQMGVGVVRYVTAEGPHDADRVAQVVPARDLGHDRRARRQLEIREQGSDLLAIERVVLGGERIDRGAHDLDALRVEPLPHELAAGEHVRLRRLDVGQQE